jgi:Family of unknown function (DUF5670)
MGHSPTPGDAIFSCRFQAKVGQKRGVDRFVTIQHDWLPDTQCPVMTRPASATRLWAVVLHSRIFGQACQASQKQRREKMSIWTILFVVLLIAWLGGFTVFHVAGGLIHLLLVFAVISLILHFVMGSRTA